MNVLITGAGGKTGQAIIAALRGRDVGLRPFLRTPKPIAGATDPFIGDLLNIAHLEQAMAGMQKVYHICPNVHEHEVEIGQKVIEAARGAGIEQFVYHSVLHPQAEAMPHHGNKLRVEEMLFESGLPFTILQPTAYMQNIEAQWQMIVETSFYTIPYPTQTQISLVDLADVATVAANVLTEKGHSGAIYELVGTKPLSQNELAKTMSHILGHAIVAQEIKIDVWRDRVQTAVSPYALETLTSMFRYYAQFGLVGNSTILTHLLEREPTSFNVCVRRWLENL